MKLEKEQKIHIIRERLQDEPLAGSNDGIANIRLQIPKGTKIMRRFHKTECIQSINDFLYLYFHDNQMEITNFAISTSYPKRDLDDETQTLEALGLFPSAALMVRDLDA